jgi:hypothetical protein
MIYFPNIPVYETEPILEYPHYAGKLTDEFVWQGLVETNFIRYLAGLPDDLFIAHTLNDRAQHGAALLASTVQLTISPPRPPLVDDAFFDLAVLGTGTGNLSWGANTLWEAVKAYMVCDDFLNIRHLGHRRWILNPPLYRVGFGFADRYASMQVLDRGRNESVSYEKTAWPAAGWFPTEYMTGHQAWSVTLNPLIYDRERTSEIRVTLTRKYDNAVWHFTPDDTDPEGKFFNVSTHEYGVPFCVIFRPDGIERYHPSDGFTVDISGVYLLNGTQTQISYETDFFQLFGVLSFQAEGQEVTKDIGTRREISIIPPILVDESMGMTFVPLQAMAELMGGTVVRNNVRNSVTVEYRSLVVEFPLSGHSAWINGRHHTMRTPLRVTDDGRAMISVRELVNVLGAELHWCEGTRGITIIYLP